MLSGNPLQNSVHLQWLQKPTHKQTPPSALYCVRQMACQFLKSTYFMRVCTQTSISSPAVNSNADKFIPSSNGLDDSRSAAFKKLSIQNPHTSYHQHYSHYRSMFWNACVSLCLSLLQCMPGWPLKLQNEQAMVNQWDLLLNSEEVEQWIPWGTGELSVWPMEMLGHYHR